MKIFEYKVYDSAGSYIKTWTDVVSEPSFSQEINSPASEMVVSLARNVDDYGEEVDVKFKNIVKVYLKDAEATTPSLFFQGTIVDYTPIYGPNEHVDVVLFSFGAELDQMIYTGSDTADQSQVTDNTTDTFGSPSTRLAQSFIPTVSALTAIEVKLHSATPVTVQLTVHEDSAGQPKTVTVTDGSAIKEITDTSSTLQRFSFSTAPSLTIGATYWIVLTA